MFIVQNSVLLNLLSITLQQVFSHVLDSFHFLLATQNQLIVLDTSDLQDIHTVKRYSLPSPGTALAWSPISTTLEFKIAVASQDCSIMIYTSSQKTPECITTQLIPSLRDPIQCISFDSSEGNYFCCCSDDSYLRVWCFNELDPQEHIFSLKLESRGISCVFHPGLTEHVLIAEESGCIRFLNISNREWIFTTMHPHMGDPSMNLVDADWNLEDPNVFGALIGDKWMVWNMSHTPLHLPGVQGDVHLTGSKYFRYFFNFFSILKTISYEKMVQKKS